MNKYNIADQRGQLMLIDNVDLLDAAYWLGVYEARYPYGKPYPNGKGKYLFTFSIVEVS